MSNESEIVKRLEDIEKHLEQQDVETEKASFMAPLSFGASLALAGVSLGLGALCGLHLSAYVLILIGLAAIILSLRKRRKVGKGNLPR